MIEASEIYFQRNAKNKEHDERQIQQILIQTQHLLSRKLLAAIEQDIQTDHILNLHLELR